MQVKPEEINKLGDNETEKAVSALDELDDLQKQFDTEERKYKMERDLAKKGFVEEESKEPVSKATGFGVIAKILRNQALDEDELKLVEVQDELLEKALTTGTNAANGENHLIPEDVRTAINELRRTYISAKELTTTIPTESLSGSFVFEDGTPVGLVAFDDGGDISATGGEPEFVRKSWTIKFFGKIIPVSNILSIAEKSGLMAYLNKWFLKNAIIAENQKIFVCLKDGKTAKPL